MSTHKAMSKKITAADYKTIAIESGLTERLIKTVAAVESAGRGFGDDGKILIQFEPVFIAEIVNRQTFDVFHRQKRNFVFGRSGI